ncbi:Rne/Rng family ribonuclease [Mesobacillus foraminis]|uniref:Rne/Rng family ribonuclease n=1 Tax=Mesobacillus foraminis TaxID=279826 RepID=UPI000EF50808|nr:ribonuclease E/G [Mesobacillus foraminis]
MNKLIINSLTREKRFALLKNGRLERLYIEQPGHEALVGNVFLGTVEKVVPGMNAAFVNFGGEKNGFLYRDKIPAYVLDRGSKEEKRNRSISGYVHQGQKLLVQIEKDAAGTKGARLTGIIELQGNHLIYMPSGKYVAISKKVEDPILRKRWRDFGNSIKSEEEGLIFRTSAITAGEAALEKELKLLRQQYKEIFLQAKNMKKPGLVVEKDLFYEELSDELERMETAEIVLDDQGLKKKLETFCTARKKEVELYYHHQDVSIFSYYGIEKEVDRALKKVVWLDNGAYLIFDEAEALTIIDVNTGKFSGKGDLAETVLETNKLAAEEVCRQIRLRDLAGMILIDFIDMKDSRDREKVLRRVEKGLAEDQRRTRIAGFTDLGILQLTRKKTKNSISEALTDRCQTCGGTGKVLSAETMAFRLERELWEHRHADHDAVLVSATRAVIDIFSGENNHHRSRLEDTIGLKIYFTVQQSDKPEYQIRQLGTMKELSEKASQ